MGNAYSLGSGVNVTSFDNDGRQSMAGNAQVFRKVVIANANLGKGTTAPAEVVIGNFTGWEFDVNDDAVVTTAIPKDWAAGTDIVIQACWYCNEAYAPGNGEVRWNAAWSCAPHDVAEALDAPTHTGSGNSGDINIPATAKYLLENDIVTIPGASIAAGDEIGVTVSRVALGAGNNPTAKPTMLHLYLKYKVGQIGSAT